MNLSPWLLALLLPQDKPSSETIVIPGTKVKFEMVHIAGGRIKPAGFEKEVELKPFWIGTCEVTWEEFNAFYNSTDPQSHGYVKVDGVTGPSRGVPFLQQTGMPPEFAEPRRPVVNPRWHTAVAYGDWLSRKTGKRFRLPTEAEWEFACGAAPASTDDYAWHKDNSGEATHVAGGKKPNRFGLYDMMGNVWEYGLEFSRLSEYSPVVRGGAWNAEARPATRKVIPEEWYGTDPQRPRSIWWLTDDFSQGFRLVRVPDSGGQDEAAYSGKIGIKLGKAEAIPLKDRPAAGSSLVRVSGTVTNGGSRALDELELKVYYLDKKGAPHLCDRAEKDPGRATFGFCHPALANSAHPGEHREPLQPGASRAFVVEIPKAYDNIEEKFGAQVTGVQFGK